MIRSVLRPGPVVAAALLSAILAAQSNAQPPRLWAALKQIPERARAWDAAERASNPAIVRSQFVRLNLFAYYWNRTRLGW